MIARASCHRFAVAVAVVVVGVDLPKIRFMC